MASVCIPNLESKASENIAWMQRSGSRRLKFLHGCHRFGQSIERDFCIQVMNMMVSNVASEPMHQIAHANVEDDFKAATT